MLRGTQGYPLGVVNVVDPRAATGFRHYGTASPFEYENVRFLFMHKVLIEDGKRHPMGRRPPDARAAN